MNTQEQEKNFDQMKKKIRTQANNNACKLAAARASAKGLIFVALFYAAIAALPFLILFDSTSGGVVLAGMLGAIIGILNACVNYSIQALSDLLIVTSCNEEISRLKLAKAEGRVPEYLHDLTIN